MNLKQTIAWCILSIGVVLMIYAVRTAVEIVFPMALGCGMLLVGAGAAAYWNRKDSPSTTNK